MKIHFLFFFVALISGLTGAAGGQVVNVILNDNLSYNTHGQTIAVTHTISNEFALDLENITITDEIPESATLHYISQAYTLTNREMSFIIQTLQPGETKTITYLYSVPAGEYSLKMSKNTYRMNFEDHKMIPETINFKSKVIESVQCFEPETLQAKPSAEEMAGPAYAIIILGALYFLVIK